MIIDKPDHLLFIEPRQPPTAPVIDSITCKLTAAWRARKTGGIRYRGQHQCTANDGATSDNADHWVAGLQTHSLCIHYVACHRAEVPQADLDRIAGFDFGEIDPTAGEVSGDWRACESRDGTTAAPAVKTTQEKRWR